MKGDFSRQTFIKENHYSGVLMQQGRVQVDADWNEQQAIQRYRIETESGDVIGLCGAPEIDPGFEITVKEKGDTLWIGTGRYYVNGVLCENEEEVRYEDQPDLLDPGSVAHVLAGGKLAVLKAQRVGLVYLDVWQRHITTLEDGHIREKALGGPDTATRAKTLWQVRVAPIKVDIAKLNEFSKVLQQKTKLQEKLRKAGDSPSKVNSILGDLAAIPRKIDALLGGIPCRSPFPEWTKLTAPSTGTLNARTRPETAPKSPCDVAAGGGYRRLENQLYRVEIHEGGSFKASGATKKATFKWSRENGAVVTAWEGQSGSNDEILTVASTGRDSALGFAAGQWVELTDDKHELDGVPGVLVQLSKVEGNTLVIKPATVIPAGASIQRSSFSHNPKVRRWDSSNGVDPVDATTTDDDWYDLEDGIQVQFSDGTYHSGDYWLIPARTDGATIEWPPFSNPNAAPTVQPPLGIHHDYCRLALVYLDESEDLHVLKDCRQIFPPLTGLLDFFYVGGDGQEAMPDLTQPQNLVPLAEPLEVRVANGHIPVPAATVQFEITQGNGQLLGVGNKVPVQTDDNGLARCTWKLDSTTQDQQVLATLLDDNGAPMPVVIRFHANLSVASEVAYNPGPCVSLQDRKNVQDALDGLAQLVSLYPVSGDAQEVMPGETLDQLVVAAASPCGPVPGAVVRFEVKSGGGRLDGGSAPVEVATDENGTAACTWTLGQSTANQQVTATLLPDGVHHLAAPTLVCFTANLSVARHVTYDPAQCSELSGIQNVQDAIDALCRRPTGGGCSVVVGPDRNLEEIIQKMLEVGSSKEGPLDVCICLLPGDHEVERLSIGGTDERPVNLKIAGCGPGTRVHTKGSWKFVGLNAITLRDVQILGDGVSELMIFDHCAQVTMESCRVSQTLLETGGFLCLIAVSGKIRLAGNVLESTRTQKSKISPSDVLKGLNQSIVNLFAAANSREFSRQADAAAKNLAAMEVSKRQAFAKSLRTEAARAKNDLTETESRSYSKLASILEKETADSKLLAGAMKDVFGAANEVPGLAVILDSPDADTLVMDNRVVGEISLYGRPAADDLSDDELKKFAGRLHEGGVILDVSQGILHLCNNTLTTVRTGDRVVQAVRKDNLLSDIYRSVFVTDNWMATRPQRFTTVVAERLTLTANSYDAGAGTHAGTTIAVGATFTGNQALNDKVVLTDISRFQKSASGVPGANKAANVGINIVEL